MKIVDQRILTVDKTLKTNRRYLTKEVKKAILLAKGKVFPVLIEPSNEEIEERNFGNAVGTAFNFKIENGSLMCDLNFKPGNYDFKDKYATLTSIGKTFGDRVFDIEFLCITISRWSSDENNKIKVVANNLDIE